jgi:hypothetical protein
VTVLAGDKGWRKFGDMSMEMDTDAVTNEKRTIYLQVIPVLLVPLKGKDFKVEAAKEEKVGERPAAAIKVTPADGKEFTLYFDKDNGLPVKLVANVIGFGGEEFTQETTYAEYKDFGGIKRATKIASKRDGETFVEQQVSDFRLQSAGKGGRQGVRRAQVAVADRERLPLRRFRPETSLSESPHRAERGDK